ncbi:hypothetical protein [Candidatus Ichthyocystis sparus]|nr:hypothetical protein [Candidatus Ichthyocystis sparus]
MQDDSDESSFAVACCGPELELISTGSVDLFSCNSKSTNGLCASASNKLFENFCNSYSFISNSGAVSEICGDNFLYKYDIDYRYKLTGNFLSIMDGYRIKFIDKTDSILDVLSCSFSFFLKELGDYDKNMTYLINKACFSFSKCVYRLRPKCIDFLRSDIIPAVIKSIFDSKVVDDGSEREMTYPEMEQFFLYFVSALDKLLMYRIMRYWQDFCDRNNKIFVYYGNPFDCAYRFYRISDHNIYYPSAFVYKFGKFISFMAVVKIDEMLGCFVGSCITALKKLVNYKCSCICYYSSGFSDNLNKLRSKINDLIEEEFDKKIINEGINDRFSNFLKDIVIWNEDGSTEVGGVLIFDNIIDHMRNLLVSKFVSDSHKIIENFQKKMLESRRSLIFSKYLPAIENRWGVKLHPEDDYKILSIKSKFFGKSKKIIGDKFFSILKEERVLLDESVDWNKISKSIFPIAQENIRHLVDAEHEEISRFLLNARVIENIDIFDGYCAGTRKVTAGERDNILKISYNSVHRKNIILSNRVWRGLIQNKSINISKGVASDCQLGESEKNTVFDVGRALGDDNFSDVNFEQSDLPASTPASLWLLSKKDKIFNVWGLNLHPDDDKLIFFIRRKFSSQIKDHLYKLFSDMLDLGIVLPSGVVLRDCSWAAVSGELYEIAIKSIDYINKKQYEELDRALSNSRVVDIDKGDSSFCIIRKVTDDEKKELVTCVTKLIDRRLRDSIRLSWGRVVSKHSSDIGYGYKEKSKFVGSGRDGSWGVKLRYSDNISILNARRKFSSRIKHVVRDKFSSMLNNKHVFDDGTFIGLFAWFRVSKKLLPLAKDEASPILENQRLELEEIISRSRVVVDSFDRELTREEKSDVLKNIMSFAYHSLKVLFRRIWDDVIISARDGSTGIGDTIENFPPNMVGCDVVEETSQSIDDVVAIELGSCDKDDNLMVNLCHEDDYVVLSVKRKFSSEICNFIRNRYIEMIRESYVFDDGTVICMCSWRDISKKILPILKKEVAVILEKERKEVNDVLLNSRVDISLSKGSGATRITRNIKSEEVPIVLETVMKPVYKQVLRNFGQIWTKVVNLPLARLVDISEEQKLELDNIKIEFIGSLSPIVSEIDGPLSSAASDVLYERSDNLFNEGGFLSRVDLLLSRAKVFSKSGGGRFITDEEKKCVLKEFMDQVRSDRDCFIRKRVGKYCNKLR